jgi:hypothetical protein
MDPPSSFVYSCGNRSGGMFIVEAVAVAVAVEAAVTWLTPGPHRSRRRALLGPRWAHAVDSYP